jgi:hypothetical protein
MVLSATQTALVFQALATEPEGEMATYGHRAILLRSSVPERMAWCSAILAKHPPRPIRLSPLDQAALEAVLADLAGEPLTAWPIAAVGRAAAVGYRRTECPVVTIAFPLLSHPLYLDGMRRLLRDRWRLEGGRSLFQMDVQNAVEALLKTAPGRLTVAELAFALLGTLHRLADPTGIRWGRMLEGRG